MKDETYKIVVTALSFMTLWWYMWLRAWKQMKREERREKLMYRGEEE